MGVEPGSYPGAEPKLARGHPVGFPRSVGIGQVGNTLKPLNGMRGAVNQWAATA